MLQVGDERSRRVEAIWAQVGTVLKQLLKQRDASVFAQPVDAVKLQVSSPLATSLHAPCMCFEGSTLPSTLWPAAASIAVTITEYAMLRAGG